MQSAKRHIQVSNAASDIHSYEEIKTAVNDVLRKRFSHDVARAAAIHVRYRDLLEHMQNLSEAGGKRLRPYLAVMSYEMYGGNNYEAMISVAASLEMLHFAMLVHDDVIDRDYLRYGTDNIAGVYQKLYKKHIPTDKDALHYAHSAAILAGDISIMTAYDLIAHSAFSPSEKLQAQNLLSQAIFEVAGGEFIDTDAPFYETKATDPLVIAETKTAGYSFITPLLTGAVLASAGDKEIASLSRFGRQLGTAYQLMDDLLGVFGDEKVTGKSVLGDMREGKRTYLAAQAFHRTSDEGKNTIKKLYGNPRLTKEQAQQLREIFVSCGAKDTVTAKIDELSAQAARTVEALNIGAGAKARLVALIVKTTRRSF